MLCSVLVISIQNLLYDQEVFIKYSFSIVKFSAVQEKNTVMVHTVHTASMSFPPICEIWE